jgi:predicted peptidase
MYRCSFILILSFTLLWPTVWAADINDFIDFSLRAPNNSLLLPGRLYVPPEASVSPRPLILFLHGIGESGTNNVSQINFLIDFLIDEAKQRGAFLYAPQTNSGWNSPIITDRITTMLDRAIIEHNVDMNRQYITGLSLGGGGVWNLLSRYPERFAAAVPTCGVGPAPDFVPANLLDEAIWAYHNRDDDVVSVTQTRNRITSLLNAAGEPVPVFPPPDPEYSIFHFDSQLLDLHYTEPSLGGHWVWFLAYADEPMYDWMFAHANVPEPYSITMSMVGIALTVCHRFRPSNRRGFREA